MPIGVHRHLNRTVAHLLFDVGDRSAILDEEATEGVPQFVKADPPKPGPLNAWEEEVVNEVGRVEDRTHTGREDQIVSDVRLILGEGFQEPLVSQVEKHLTKLA